MLYTKLVKEILRCTTHNTTSTTSKVTNASTSYEEINVHFLKAASTRQIPSHMWGGYDKCQRVHNWRERIVDRVDNSRL